MLYVKGKSGFIAVTEKISDWLENISWIANAEYIDVNHAVLVSNISSFIKTFIEKNKMPVSLSPEALCITKNNRIVSLTPMTDSDACPLEYSILEEFVKKVSRGNIYIFQRIMNQSTLCDHPCVQLLRKDIRNALADQSAVVFENNSDTQSAVKNRLFYTHFIQEQFDLYRSRVPEVQWDVLKETLIHIIMDALLVNKVAATRWQEFFSDYVKCAINQKLLQFENLKIPTESTVLFPSWFRF